MIQTNAITPFLSKVIEFPYYLKLNRDSLAKIINKVLLFENSKNQNLINNSCDKIWFSLIFCVLME